MHADIDVTLDLRGDAKGKDPDTHSETLRRYHKMLWRKPLPSGPLFDLDDATPGCYLHHKAPQHKFCLSSDAVIPTFSYRPEITALTSPEELEAFDSVSYTIGGMMVFPAFQIHRKWTINQARGCTRKIADRFDLTLECIRRHYSDGGESPLATVLARYSEFFDLFVDFPRFVEFFLLQDLVTADGSAVKFSTPFNGFNSPAIPSTAAEYREYREAATAFIEARNRRILQSREVS
ncbi:MAG: hypothetical protein U0Q55_13375 [Vicinamibacterales bacterium]